MATRANLFNETYKKTGQASKGEDKGFVNAKAQTSIAAKKNGTTSIASGIYAQYKVDKNSGVATEISLQSTTTTVQKELNMNDLIINKHKFNNQLFEFTNLKYNMNTMMGGLTVDTTILVKVWEPTLEKYVLIRRPARFPVFSNLLDACVVDPRLGIEENISADLLQYKLTLNHISDTNNIAKTTSEEGEDEYV